MCGCYEVAREVLLIARAGRKRKKDKKRLVLWCFLVYYVQMQIITNYGILKTKKLGGVNHLKVTVWGFKRAGSQAPETIYYKYRGRWISRYERRLRWSSENLVSFFMQHYLSAHYAPIISEMIWQDNPFLKMIEKDGSFSGTYIPVPIMYGDYK